MSTGSVDRIPQLAIPSGMPDTATRTANGVPCPNHRWRSSDLFGSAQEVEIEHGDAVYRLRQTALGKLILTK